MKLLTEKQKQWMIRSTIDEDDLCMFPNFGFTVYSEPTYSSGENFETNPFTKSLSGELFLTKKKVNGFWLGNFHNRPKGPDFYLHEDELSRRGLIVILLLFVISSIPLIIYNWLQGGVDKIESKV